VAHMQVEPGGAGASWFFDIATLVFWVLGGARRCSSRCAF
jgi:hypothetical protein